MPGYKYYRMYSAHVLIFSLFLMQDNHGSDAVNHKESEALLIPTKSFESGDVLLIYV